MPPRTLDAVHLSWDEARRRVLEAVRVLAPQRVALAAARGRALRHDVTAPHDLPPFANSSMDGFAVRASDLLTVSNTAPIEMQVGLVLPAGVVADRPLGTREAARIMTGAEPPQGADAIVPFEDCERIEGSGHERVRFTRPVRPGDHMRLAGADLAAGARALDSGRELSPHDIALLAALGIPEIDVGPAPRVAIVSTGDELLGISEALRPGAIRDSNVPLLGMLLAEVGCDLVSAARVGDDPVAVASAISQALTHADVVLSIGGVSAGDFDPVKLGLASITGIELWRVAMKPGRPQAFGAPGARLYFGLPGNPASVACVFEALVRPALRALQGFRVIERPRMDVRAAATIVSRRGRTDFIRATLQRRDHAWWAAEAGAQVSGHLTPQSLAHALLIIPEERESLASGDAAEAWLLRWPE